MPNTLCMVPIPLKRGSFLYPERQPIAHEKIKIQQSLVRQRIQRFTPAQIDIVIDIKIDNPNIHFGHRTMSHFVLHSIFIT